jgi:uncharacterized lipoprotein YmbA
MMLRFLVVLALALPALAGCGTSPPPVLYTLASQPGPVVHTRKISVELRRVGLAGYLDRPEIVRGTVDFRLQVTDGDRWGEPLGRMLDRIAESGAISTRPDTVLEIDIQRLDADPGGMMVLLAQVAVRPEGKAASAQTIRLTTPITGAGSQAHAAAMSVVVGQLADRVANLLTKG